MAEDPAKGAAGDVELERLVSNAKTAVELRNIQAGSAVEGHDPKACPCVSHNWMGGPSREQGNVPTGQPVEAAQ